MAKSPNGRDSHRDSKTLPEAVKTLARKHGINLMHDPELLKIIENVNLNKNIPEEIYSLLAEIIIHVHKLKDQWKPE